MRSGLVFTALLCLATWITIAHAAHGPLGNHCCNQWSTTRLPLQRIVNYTVQFEGSCPIKAIKFKTVQGKTICSDPNTPWAIKAMKKVDEETKKKALLEQGQSEVGSTSNTTPAAPTQELTTEEMQKWTETEVEDPQKVDEETKKKALQEQGQSEVGSTSNTTPAAPTQELTTEEMQKLTEAKVEDSQKMDEETKKKALQEQGQIEMRSTSDITPAASFKSKKAPRRKCKTGRRRMRRRLRRGRKGQRRRA